MTYNSCMTKYICTTYSPATVLGKGSFGEVLKAIYKGKAVALKIFSPRVAEMHNTTPNQLIRQEVHCFFIVFFHDCVFRSLF